MKKIIYQDGTVKISQYSWEYEHDPDFESVKEATDNEVMSYIQMLEDQIEKIMAYSEDNVLYVNKDEKKIFKSKYFEFEVHPDNRSKYVRYIPMILE